ncbi:MAG: hypothetical protein A2001_00460 [Treponema sp. GWC1_61_84]|nr:MAG: hypothetical protein A2001_00460 [Treponema sp. GWC1_61_84]
MKELIYMDPKTIFLMLWLGNLILAVLFLSFPKVKNRRTESLWIAAKFSEAIAYGGLILIAIGKSGIFLMLVSNILLYLGFALEAGAVWEYRGYKNWPRYILPFLISAIFIRTFTGIFGLRANLNITISSYVIGIFFLLATLPLIPDKEEKAVLNRVIIAVNGIPALLNLVRGTFSFFISGNTLGSGNIINLLTYLAMFVFMISNGFGFLLLVREKAERELKHLATIDYLTGLLNRRAFLEQADKCLLMARRRGSSTALLVFDLDYFKRINDNYGHAIGDQVLQAFARICRDRLRNTDISGRTGGEEFAVFLNDCALEDAIRIAEDLRGSVADHSVTVDTVAIRFTVSIGLRLFGAVDTLDDALISADKALYEAKRSGRNTVVVA